MGGFLSEILAHRGSWNSGLRILLYQTTSHINKGYNYAKLYSNNVVAIANKLVVTWNKTYISEGFSTNFGMFLIYTLIRGSF